MRSPGDRTCVQGRQPYISLSHSAASNEQKRVISLRAAIVQVYLLVLLLCFCMGTELQAARTRELADKAWRTHRG